MCSALKYLFTDLAGTPRMVMDGSAAIVSRHDYAPFGEDLLAGVSGRTTGQGYNQTDNVRQTYSGMEKDAATSLSHTQWRKYGNTQGRWTSVDPYGGSMSLSDPQSHNRYAYVQNDPVNFVDPTGLDDTLPDDGPPIRIESWDFRASLFGSYFLPASQGGFSGFFVVFFQNNMGGGGTELQNPTPTPTPQPNCGVNPITGKPGFTGDPRGVPGNLRPGKGGEGYFGAPRRKAGTHKGLDISGVSKSSPVYANRAGTIIFAGKAGDAGNTVIIGHGDGIETRYGHLSGFASGIKESSEVKEGQQIGIVGQTGNASGQPLSEAHVHFAVKADRKIIDPESYLNSPCPKK